VKLDPTTSLQESKIKETCTFGNIEVADESGLFDPSEILAELRKRGATIEGNRRCSNCWSAPKKRSAGCYPVPR
jgi:hypothetical protein